MTEQWSLPAYAVLLVAVVVLAVVLVLLALVARTAWREHLLGERLTATAAEVRALRDDVDALGALGALGAPDGPGATARRRADPDTPERQPDYVITRVGDQEPRTDDDVVAAGPARVVAAPLFADLVLRESVVQAAALAAGVRRALAPETRHRVRVEMRREVKRARKQRRVDLRAARRDREARQRAAVDEGSAA